MSKTLQQQIEQLEDTQHFIRRHRDFFNEDNLCFFTGYSVDLDGITFQPLHSGYALLQELQQKFEIVFTRQMDSSGCYQWVSVCDEVPITIKANEIIDHSGTTIDFEHAKAPITPTPEQ
jgi:hypothetical protein